MGYREDLAGRERTILNQMEAAEWAGSKEVLALLQKELACVKGLLGEVEARIQALLATLPEAEVLMALPGVGPQVAAAVLALLPPELWGRAKRAASYAGLIPEREESGKSVERSRLSKKGLPSCGESSTWAPWWRCAMTRRCGPSTTACSRGERERSRRWWPWPTSSSGG